MTKKLWAEWLGTFWLVIGGCGAAVLAGDFIGTYGVAVAFGLTVLTGAYAFGRISGGHFNPAVSLGLWAAGRLPTRELLPYVVAQVVGGLFAALLLYQIASGNPEFGTVEGGAGVFATNGFGLGSPAAYDLSSAFLTESVLTAFFVLVILGVTGKDGPAAAAPLAIGLALALIHLISIPVTNTSVNPARSTAVAIVMGGLPLQQLWLFWLAPCLGALIGAAVHRNVLQGH